MIFIMSYLYIEDLSPRPRSWTSARRPWICSRTGWSSCCGRPWPRPRASHGTPWDLAALAATATAPTATGRSGRRRCGWRWNCRDLPTWDVKNAVWIDLDFGWKSGEHPAIDHPDSSTENSVEELVELVDGGWVAFWRMIVPADPGSSGSALLERFSQRCCMIRTCPKKFRSEKNGAALVSLCMWLILGCGRVWLVSVDELWCSVPSFSFRFSDLMWLDAETQHWFLRWDPKVDPWRQQIVMSKAKSTCIPVVPNSKSNFRFDGSYRIEIHMIHGLISRIGQAAVGTSAFHGHLRDLWRWLWATRGWGLQQLWAMPSAEHQPAWSQGDPGGMGGLLGGNASRGVAESVSSNVIQCLIQSKNLSFSCLISMIKLLKPQQVSQHGQDTVRKNLNQTTKPQTDWSDCRVISSIEHQVLVT